MPESGAEKIIVRGASGDLWSISTDTIPTKLSAAQKTELENFINETNNNLAALFASGNPGVKLGITILEAPF
jgi:hypothetical protein